MLIGVSLADATGERPSPAACAGKGVRNAAGVPACWRAPRC
jgi:hypothetical protein